MLRIPNVRQQNSTKRPVPKGTGLLLRGMDHLNTVQVFVMVMMPTMIALMMPAM